MIKAKETFPGAESWLKDPETVPLLQLKTSTAGLGSFPVMEDNLQHMNIGKDSLYNKC